MGIGAINADIRWELFWSTCSHFFNLAGNRVVQVPMFYFLLLYAGRSLTFIDVFWISNLDVKIREAASVDTNLNNRYLSQGWIVCFIKNKIWYKTLMILVQC